MALKYALKITWGSQVWPSDRMRGHPDRMDETFCSIRIGWAPSDRMEASDSKMVSTEFVDLSLSFP